jgi:endonuclease YncB( thermonuclease family)
VNAVHGFLAGIGQEELGELPPNAMGIFDPSVLKSVPNQGPRSRLPRVAIPEGLRFGPYVHTYVSREKRALNSRMTSIIGGLRGLFSLCHTCKGAGSIRELVRAGYWADRETWIEPVYRTKVCPTCEGDRKLFHATKGERVFAQYTRREQQGRSGAFDVARDRFLRRLYATQRSFQTRTKVRIEVIGRYGVVHGAPNNPLFPLHFKLLPTGAKYEWYIHVEELNGSFRFGAETGHVPAQSVVAEVAAADILILPDGEIVRICGITVPIAGGKVAKPDLGSVHETARAVVRQELLGRTVALTSDKYSKLTCDGHAIAFVELEGKDYGEELIRRGLARRHPKHGHMRFARYKKAESAAKKAKVGIWKD